MRHLLIAIIIMTASSIALASGEVLKLNTSGVEYCHGVKPLRFSPRSDIDMWVVFDSQTSATLYADAGLTMDIATLDISIDYVSSKQSSFTGFYGYSDSYIAVAGTLGVDTAGNIKTLKATVIRNGVFNSCYSQAKATGKRII